MWSLELRVGVGVVLVGVVDVLLLFVNFVNLFCKLD